MWENVGMARTEGVRSKRRSSRFRRLRKEFWKDVKVRGQGSDKDFNVRSSKRRCVWPTSSNWAN